MKKAWGQIAPRILGHCQYNRLLGRYKASGQAFLVSELGCYRIAIEHTKPIGCEIVLILAACCQCIVLMDQLLTIRMSGPDNSRR